MVLKDFGYKEKHYCNLYNAKELNGGKLRVAIMEDESSKELEDIVEIALPEYYDKSKSMQHDYKIARVYTNFIKGFEEGIEVYHVPNNYYGGLWVLMNNIDILSMSMSSCRAPEHIQKEIANKTFIVTSAGS